MKHVNKLLISTIFILCQTLRREGNNGFLIRTGGHLESLLGTKISSAVFDDGPLGHGPACNRPDPSLHCARLTLSTPPPLSSISSPSASIIQNIPVSGPLLDGSLLGAGPRFGNISSAAHPAPLGLSSPPPSLGQNPAVSSDRAEDSGRELRLSPQFNSLTDMVRKNVKARMELEGSILGLPGNSQAPLDRLCSLINVSRGFADSCIDNQGPSHHTRAKSAAKISAPSSSSGGDSFYCPPMKKAQLLLQKKWGFDSVGELDRGKKSNVRILKRYPNPPLSSDDINTIALACGAQDLLKANLDLARSQASM